MGGNDKSRGAKAPTDMKRLNGEMEGSDKSELDLRDLLLQEFQGAWNHYRHLENERSWSMGFLFTISLGSIGWTAKMLSQPTSEGNVNARFASMFIMAAVCALAITIYGRLNKTRFALRHYVKAWRFVRRKFYRKSYKELSRELDVYHNKCVQTFFLSHTVTTTWMIWVVIIGSLAYLILGVIGCWPLLLFGRVHRVVIAVLVLSLLLFVFAVVCDVRRAEAKAMKEPHDDEPGPT